VSLTAGSRLGPYEILAPLGAGGMGEVYRARDARLGREVAIKVLPESVAADPDRLARFEREAKAVAALSHPNILAIFDFGTHEGISYAVMELLEGETLRGKLDAGPITQKQAVDYAQQIVKGLSAAHEKGVVHRDLKPENLFVMKDGHVKILDFGLAKRVELVAPGEETSAPTASGHTQPGTVMGTVGYMSPEQVRGLPVDHRSDIFSFGAILYELLSGQRAFKRDSAADTMAAILKEEPPELSESRRNISPALDHVVQHCLEKSPAARFQAARDIAFALEEASGGPSTPAPAVIAVEPRARVKRAAAIVAGALVLLAALFAADAGGVRTRLFGGRGRIESVAVLPLENFSRDPEQEYFADGLTEALITDLAQVRALRVISRTSVMGYKGAKKPLPQIGRELNVDAVIEGSVQKSGGRVRVTAQLIQASTDRHLWARSYERDVKDVLSLQSEIARAVAEEVRAALTPEEKVRLTKAKPVDPEVHELYLRGRFHWNRGTETELREAIADFERALAKDPAFAPAYSGLADAYAALSDVYRPPYEVMPKSRAAAVRALALDETLADAHVSLANVALNYEWDWALVEREVRRALELNPNSASAHDVRGLYLGIVLGRGPEALPEYRRALELDPLSLSVNFDAGWNRLMAREYDQAIGHFRRAAELEPTFGWAQAGLGVALLWKGKKAEAVAAADQALKVDDTPTVMATAAGVYAAAGRSDRAREVLARLAEISKARYACPYEVAIVHVGLGEKEEAFRWLEKGFRDRSLCMVMTRADPRIDPLRSDPRYADLVRRIGFPP
jgi:eukaryotic-like serine/threonine-protein kinase